MNLSALSAKETAEQGCARLCRSENPNYYGCGVTHLVGSYWNCNCCENVGAGIDMQSLERASFDMSGHETSWDDNTATFVRHK